MIEYVTPVAPGVNVEGPVIDPAAPGNDVTVIVPVALTVPHPPVRGIV